MNECICRYCSRECKNANSLRCHERLCSLNPNRQTSNLSKYMLEIKEGKRKIWSKGQTKLTNETLKSAGEKLKKYSGKLNSMYGKYHTDLAKQKISQGMILAHKEGRASSWIGRRKRSYAEQSWFDIFTRANIKFENNYFVQPYWLDFAWPEKKLYFEVDGKTHLTTEGVEHDNKRTEFLKESGWTLIGRCNWSEYQRMSDEQRQIYVDSILVNIKGSNSIQKVCSTFFGIVAQS